LGKIELSNSGNFPSLVPLFSPPIVQVRGNPIYIWKMESQKLDASTMECLLAKIKEVQLNEKIIVKRGWKAR
jgi:hypothetical protein